MRSCCARSRRRGPRLGSDKGISGWVWPISWSSPAACWRWSTAASPAARCWRPMPAPRACRRSSAAVQEGARAYLNRQYTTIAIVGVVILIMLGFTLGIRVAIGFLIGAVLSGGGRLYRHERLGARQRPHRPGVAQRAWPPASTSPSSRAPSPGMLVVGLGLLGVADLYSSCAPRMPATTCARSWRRWSRSPSAPR